jgi:hypothetical protein
MTAFMSASTAAGAAVLLGRVRELAESWTAGEGWAVHYGRLVLAVTGPGEPEKPAPAPEEEAPPCARCLGEPVAVPGAGPFGEYGQECIDQCNGSQDPCHRCAVCSPEGTP